MISVATPETIRVLRPVARRASRVGACRKASVVVRVLSGCGPRMAGNSGMSSGV